MNILRNHLGQIVTIDEDREVALLGPTARGRRTVQAQVKR